MPANSRWDLIRRLRVNKVIVTSDKRNNYRSPECALKYIVHPWYKYEHTQWRHQLIVVLTCMNILSLAVVPLTEFIRNFTGFLGSSRRYQITSTSRISNATPRKLQPFIWTGEYTAPHSTTQYHTALELTVKEEINIENTFAARGV